MHAAGLNDRNHRDSTKHWPAHQSMWAFNQMQKQTMIYKMYNWTVNTSLSSSSWVQYLMHRFIFAALFASLFSASSLSMFTTLFAVPSFWAWGCWWRHRVEGHALPNQMKIFALLLWLRLIILLNQIDKPSWRIEPENFKQSTYYKLLSCNQPTIN
jgi:hypothetical protein